MKDQGFLELHKIYYGKKTPLNYNENSPWMKNLLTELSEGVELSLESSEHATLQFAGVAFKNKDRTYEECVFLEGKLLARFPVICANTGEVFLDELSVLVQSCFIDEKYQSEQDMADEIEIQLEGVAWDLYFQTKNSLNLSETFHEYLFLNKNPVPMKESGDEVIEGEKVFSKELLH